MPIIQFPASLPAIQSAVSISGGGDGARAKLDIPQSHLMQAMQLAALQGVVLYVTVSTDAPKDN